MKYIYQKQKLYTYHRQLQSFLSKVYRLTNVILGIHVAYPVQEHNLDYTFSDQSYWKTIVKT